MDTSGTLRGLTAGLVGGAVASWVMEQFQSLTTKLSQQDDQQGPSESEDDQQQQGEEQSATVLTAKAVSRTLLHRDLTKQERPAAGRIVHYAYGTTIGGLYGALAGPLPAVTTGAGTLYGTAVWLVGDEAVVPMLGLSKSPTSYPPSTHAYALTSHLVYGLTLEAVRRAVHRIL